MFAEIGAESFHARLGERGVDLPVRRQADGRLTPASVEQIQGALRTLAGGRPGWGKVRVCCALPGRGLIFRTMSLPAAAGEIPRLLPLQMEAEFPLPPEALAWGWMPLPSSEPSPTEPKQQVLVAALRREAVEDHAALFGSWAAEVVFTPAALARAELIPRRPARFALLEAGARHCELLLWDAGEAPVVRPVAWGPESQAGADGSVRTGSGSSQGAAVSGTGNWTAWVRQAPLWISGPGAAAALQSGAVAGIASMGEVQKLADTGAGGAGISTAIQGLMRRGVPSAASAEPGFIALRTAVPSEAARRLSQRIPRRPLSVAVALLVLVLAFPYLEAWGLKPRLSRRLTELKSDSAQLAVIDRELSFLRYLELNQAPHLDAAYVVAQAAPSGTRVETLSINRQGEVSLTGYLRDLAQVGDFRLKLVNSGFFSSVVVEDQTPTPDRQRINFRIAARWKDSSEREGLALGPNLPPGGSNAPAAPGGPVRPPPPTPGTPP
ncbi:MAG: PilN domain-containing protein [Verrucomicrobia bacterium]|nr:PilN domain-containing protein [Verrucomicrobiota bacterium]